MNTNAQQIPEKILSIMIVRKANQNHSEVSLHTTPRMAVVKKEKEKYRWWGCETRETLLLVEMSAKCNTDAAAKLH